MIKRNLSCINIALLKRKKSKKEVNILKTIFSIRHTNILKGCAVILLLFHHLFYKLEFFENCFVFCQLDMIVCNKFAQYSKVCVALFLILSGYGLTVSANKRLEPITWKYSFEHIVKLMINFWVIYLLFVPLGLIFGRNPIEIYGTGVNGIYNFLVDFFGVAHLFNTPTFNATWWFMGEILRLYILFPLLYSCVKNNKILLLGLGVVMCFFYDNLVWFLPFICGMLIAEKDYFSWYINLKGSKKCMIILAFFAFVLIRPIFEVKIDTMFALGIITFILLFIKPESIFGRVFEVLGKHSGNLFMFHTFIYAYYFKDFIYGFYHPVIILLILLIVCLVISWTIERLKHILRLNKVQGLLFEHKRM